MNDLNEGLTGQRGVCNRVPRDPVANICKAEINHFRLADDPERSCYNCTEKRGVPWLWCDQIGRQAQKGMTCDKWQCNEPMEG